MRIAFVVTDLGLSGGINVIVHHAEYLSRQKDASVFIIVENKTNYSWVGDRLNSVSVLDQSSSIDLNFDFVIATFWSTLKGIGQYKSKRYIWFCQSMEDRFYPRGTINRLAAELCFTLPIDVITEASWIQRVLTQACNERDVQLVLNGMDKSTFFVTKNKDVQQDSPLRVLVEGSYSSITKGIPFALHGTLSAESDFELRHLSRDKKYLQKDKRYKRLVKEFSLEEMAQHYAWADVIVKTSEVEGMFGPPLEAFHCGATAIVTPVTGYDEYIQHEYNALVVPWGDERTLGKYVDELNLDREKLARLKANALVTATKWPNWEQASSDFMTALDFLSTKRDAASLATQLKQLDRDITNLKVNQRARSAKFESSYITLKKKIINADIKFWLKKIIVNPIQSMHRILEILRDYRRR